MSAKVKRIDKKDDEKTIEEMFHTLHVMTMEMNKKLRYAGDSLVASLETASKKYLTANGVMQAIDFMKQIDGGSHLLTQCEMEDCANIARELSDVAKDMANHAQGLAWDEMDTLCDKFYQDDYAIRGAITTHDLVVELMILQLCQNAGPAAVDISEAYERMNDEVKKQEAAISEIEPDWIDKYEEYLKPILESSDEDVDEQ